MSDTAETLAAAMATAFEGFSATPYLDTLAKPPRWTIGYGSVWCLDGSPVTASTPAVTREQALALAARELDQAADTISRDVQVPLSANMRAALEDFIFNLGSGAFESSTLLRKLRARDYLGAANEFAKWNHAGGVELAGLTRRCAARAALFCTPE